MSVEDPAQEFFLTVQHFGDLRDADKVKSFEIGKSVAALLSDNDGARIVHGIIYDTTYSNSQGRTFHIVTREGDTYTDLPGGRLAGI